MVELSWNRAASVVRPAPILILLFGFRDVALRAGHAEADSEPLERREELEVDLLLQVHGPVEVRGEDEVNDLEGHSRLAERGEVDPVEPGPVEALDDVADQARNALDR